MPRARRVIGAADTPRLTPRFHVGDLLSVAMFCVVSRRGEAGREAVLRYMADDYDRTYEDLERHDDDFRAAMLRAYPEFGTYLGDVSLDEFAEVWLRRREREFGRYLPAPRLPPSHPLRTRSSGTP